MDNLDRIQLYIDKENIKSFVQTKDKELFDECVRLIRKNIDIHYNFPKEEVLKDPYMRLWFRNVMGQGVGNQYAYSCSEDDILPKRPVSYKDFAPNGAEDPFGIYLLKDSEACKEVDQHKCVLIGGIGKEIEILQQLIQINEEDEVFVKDTNWAQYCPKLPLTDILLCDTYYFKDLGVYRNNRNELLRVLSSVPKNFPINVVIITVSSNISPSININDELDKIRDMVQEESNNSKSAVTIVGIPDGIIHDRALITNYYRINGTAGFQKQRHIKSDIRLEIRSHTKGSNYYNSLNLIDDTYKGAIKKAVFCIGDKSSNYNIVFPK